MDNYQFVDYWYLDMGLNFDIDSLKKELRSSVRLATNTLFILLPPIMDGRSFAGRPRWAKSLRRLLVFLCPIPHSRRDLCAFPHGLDRRGWSWANGSHEETTKEVAPLSA